jgi:hypothetical protein
MPTVQHLRSSQRRLRYAVLGLGAVLAVVVIRQAGLRRQLSRVEEHIGRVRAMNELEDDIEEVA